MSDVSDKNSERARIVSNYVRLFVTFSAGLLVVRLLAEVGSSALVVYLLILAGTGFAHFAKIIIRESVIPVLGLSYDEKLGRSFENVYWIAFLASLLAGILAVIVFAALWFLFPYLDTGAIGIVAFSVAVTSAALRTVIAALATPPLHAVLVSGRAVAYNIFLALERLADLAAVVLVLWLWDSHTEDFKTIIFFALSAGLYIGIQLLCFLYSSTLDTRFRIKKTRINSDDLRWFRGIFGWNVAVVVAFILYLRLSTFLVNVSYGEGPSLLIGVVFLLAGYQNQISIGLVIGLDAVVARIYGKSAISDKSAATNVLIQSTYIQSVFSFFSMAVLWVFAEQIFRLWLGSSLEETGWDHAEAAELFRIMALGILARSLSESWMKILNGKGRVAVYAPYLLMGGLLNSVAIAWLTLFSHWPVHDALFMLVLIFSFLHVVIHTAIIPIQLHKEIHFKMSHMIRALLIPGLLSAVLAMVFGLNLKADNNLLFSIAFLFSVGIIIVFLIHPKTASTVLDKNNSRMP